MTSTKPSIVFSDGLPESVAGFSRSQPFCLPYSENILGFGKYRQPKQWEIREINEIMNQCIDRWRYFPNPRMLSEYGRQKGWERENPATDLCNPSEKAMDGFVEVTEQMELPF